MRLFKKREGAPPPERRGDRAKLLVSIVNRDGVAKFKNILDECSVALSYHFAATGTARSAVLDYLGIGETEKSVLLSLFAESDEETIMRTIRARMTLYLAGKGIAFTVPLTGISQTVARGLVGTGNRQEVVGMTERKYDLVVAAVAANFVDEAMEAARSAGAAGGTILRARAMENARAEQSIGITLLREQEILLILTRKEDTVAIMEALSARVGAQTEAAGVIFSLPVDRTAGISAGEETEGNGGKE